MLQSTVVFFVQTAPLSGRQNISVVSANLRGENPNRRQQVSAPKSNSRSKLTPSDGEDLTLTGSAVLQALHRATVQKKRKQQKKKQQQQLKRGDEGEGQTSSGEDEFDYKNVQPINIRSDWEGRIEELEMRLQELQSKYHH